MSKKNEAWGVEVGAQAIKVMKLARSGGGVVMEDFEVLPFKHVLTTPDLNVEEAIRVNLESLATKHEFDKSTVVVSVPGHMAFARFAKLPPIESSKVKSIVAYEAQQQIPFPIDQVEWDYHVFEEEDAPDIEVGIFAITKEKVAHFLSNYRSVGLRVDALTLSPVAVYNAFAYEGGAEGGGSTVYLDIGTVSSDIIVVEEDGIWLRTLPLGGNHFTSAFMKQFKISFAKAEKLKLEASTSKYAKQIFQAMRGVFNELVAEVQRSLGFYQSLNRDAELTQIVGVGSTWKLPGLQKYLKQNLQMEVVRPDGFSRLEVDGRRAAEFSSVAVNMATAYGLALQGLGLGAVEANILPQTILRQRMWKAKQPIFAAAAACVAAGAIIAPVRVFMANSSFDAAWDRVRPNITTTIGQAQGLKSEYDTKVTAQDPRPAIRNYRRSVDYVNLYPKLIEDVASAMQTLPTNPQIAQIDWNDPDAVAQVASIPRAQRQQVWVTHIATAYKLPASTEETTADFSGGELPPPSDFGDPAGGGFDEFGPGPGYGGGFGGGFGGGVIETPQGLTPVPFPEAAEVFDAGFDEGIAGEEGLDAEGSEGGASAPAEPDLSKMPRIIVTVRGQTTMDRPTISRLLEQNFGGWLAKNADRSDRPYILVADLTNTAYASLSGVGVGSDAGALPGAGQFEGEVSGEGLRRTPTPKQDQPVDDFSNPRPLTGPVGGLGTTDPFGGGQATFQQDVEVKTPEGWYAKLGGSGGGFSMGALLPRRPLSVEDNLNDTQFTFSFEVILLSPDEARKTILNKQKQDAEGQGDDTGETTQPSAAIEADDHNEQEQSS